jgi:hypothetical protein
LPGRGRGRRRARRAGRFAREGTRPPARSSFLDRRRA